MDNIKKRIIISSQGYIIHNGPFKLNDDEIAQPSKFGIGNRKLGGINDPYIIWPRLNRPWKIELKDSDCKYIRIKHANNRDYHEILEGSTIALIHKDFDKQLFKWELIEEIEEVNLSKGIIKTYVKEISRVNKESELLYSFCNSNKIDPLFLINFISYYSLNEKLYKDKRTFDINTGVEMKAHLDMLFNTKIVNDLYCLIRDIIFNIYELARSIKKEENSNDTKCIIKSLLFELINFDDYSL